MEKYKDFLDSPEERVREATEIKEELIKIMNHVDYYIENTAAPHELVANHPRFLWYMVRYCAKLGEKARKMKDQYRP